MFHTIAMFINSLWRHMVSTILVTIDNNTLPVPAKSRYQLDHEEQT